MNSVCSVCCEFGERTDRVLRFVSATRASLSEQAPKASNSDAGGDYEPRATNCRESDGILRLLGCDSWRVLAGICMGIACSIRVERAVVDKVSARVWRMGAGWGRPIGTPFY
eukprot:1905614-Rhodomonas_salina.1